MRARIAYGVVAAVCFGLAVATAAGASPWWVLVPGAGGVLALWQAVKPCTHRHASLQPPVRNGGPDRDHARWYCDACGATWDSGLKLDAKPRQVFAGFDEDKATRAAARALSLERQRRRMAVERAGMVNKTAPRTADKPQRSGPVPIDPPRRRRDAQPRRWGTGS